MSTSHRLGILLSGRGSNFIAIADSVAAGRIPGGPGDGPKHSEIEPVK